MLLPILLNICLEIINLTHFNTFKGFPLAEMFSDILMYVGNWPSLLLKKYPYVLSMDGEVVYEGSGWISLGTFIINLLGWGLVGFIIGYVIRKKKSK